MHLGHFADLLVRGKPIPPPADTSPREYFQTGLGLYSRLGLNVWLREVVVHPETTPLFIANIYETDS